MPEPGTNPDQADRRLATNGAGGGTGTRVAAGKQETSWDEFNKKHSATKKQ